MAGADESRAVLYIHGGGFVAGVPANHRPLTWRLAAQTNCRSMPSITGWRPSISSPPGSRIA